jgi:hypothetical protein
VSFRPRAGPYTPAMPDDEPLGPDIDAILAKITVPELLPHALQLVREHRIALEDLLVTAKRCYEERFAREVECNTICGVPLADAPNVATNELAFFQADLARQLASERRRLHAELARQLELLVEHQQDSLPDA